MGKTRARTPRGLRNHSKSCAPVQTLKPSLDPGTFSQSLGLFDRNHGLPLIRAAIQTRVMGAFGFMALWTHRKAWSDEFFVRPSFIPAGS